MSEFLFKKGEEVYCEGFGYGQVSRLVSVDYAPRIVVDFDGGEAHCFTPDGYFKDPEEVKPGGYNPRLQSVNRQEDIVTSTDTLTLQPEGSVMEAVHYRKQLINTHGITYKQELARDLALRLARQNYTLMVEYPVLFAQKVVAATNAIIKELEKE